MRLRAGLLTAAVLIAVLPPTAAAAAPAVVHVPGDVATIQAAVDQVTPAGRVVVGPGTYVENVAFRNKELELESVAGPWATVIDGGGRDTAVTIRDGQTRATTLRGFTIRNGGTTGGRGGGIVVANASPTITDNVITGNRGDEGAGVWVTDGSPLIAANAIRGNSAGGRGGGIDLGGAWGTEIVGNLIEGNTAAFGGGIQMWTAGDPLVWNNVFRGNRATWGGAIEAVNYSDPLIAQNLFVDNQAGEGGALSLNPPLGFQGPIVLNNTMVGNRGERGAAMYTSGDTRAVNNIMLNAPGDAAPVARCGGGLSRYFANAVFNGTSATFEWCENVGATVTARPELRPDLSPAPGSPVIDAGDEEPLLQLLPPVDAAGSPRVVDGNGDGVQAVDIGAFEWPGRGFTPELAVGPGSVDFGTVDVGSSASHTLWVSAASLATLHVTGARFSGDAGVSVAAAPCTGVALSLLESCPVTVTFSPKAAGVHNGTVTITSDGGTAAVPVGGVGVAATLQAPWSVWTQPGGSPLDGVGTWVGAVNDPAAGPGQVAPAYFFGQLFGFANSSALGMVGLVTQPAGKFAVFNVVEPNGTLRSAVVPFEWRAGRFYFLFVHQLGPGLWGAWAYDQSAASWTLLGSLSLPPTWGKLKGQTVTALLWAGPTAASCSAYPRADVVVHPAIGFAGGTQTTALQSGGGTNPGDCPAQNTVVSEVWSRYQVGTGGRT